MRYVTFYQTTVDARIVANFYEGSDVVLYYDVQNENEINTLVLNWVKLGNLPVSA